MREPFPQDWIQLRIQEVIVNDKYKKASEGSSPYIEIGDINIKNKTATIKDKLSVKGAVMAPDYSILISKVRPTRGAISILKNHAAVSNAFTILKPKNIIKLEFLFYQLAWNNDFLNYLRTHQTGATYPIVKEQAILKYPIMVPPIEEQEYIVEILEQAELLKHKAQVISHKMSSLEQALFAKMFIKSKKWDTEKLGESLAVFRYGTSIRCDYNSAGFPVLRIPNIVSGQIQLDDLKYCTPNKDEVDKLKLEYGDVLFVRTNGNRDYVGRSAVYDLKDNFLFASYLIRARLDQRKINPWFLAAFLRTASGRDSISRVVRTTAGQSNINTEGLKNLTIPVPPIALQDRFVRVIKEMRLQIKMQELAEGKIDTLFNSILNKAFTGQIRPHIKEVKSVPTTWTSKDWFNLKLGIGAVLEALSKTPYERGEMVIAKIMFILQEVKGVPLGLTFVRHNFGPYDPNIKKAILASAFNKDKFFKVVGSGDRQVYSLGDNSAKLLSYNAKVLNQARLGLNEIIPDLSHTKSSQIELIATICKVIQDIKNTELLNIQAELDSWADKSIRFTSEEITSALNFIITQKWHESLIST
jgi:type I restriction enzyme S subunit